MRAANAAEAAAEPAGNVVNLYGRAVGDAPKKTRHDHLPGPPPTRRPEPAPASLAERLRTTRQRLRLSQMQAAEATGVSQPTLSRAERGDSVSASPRRKLQAWLTLHEDESPV